MIMSKVQVNFPKTFIVNEETVREMMDLDEERDLDAIKKAHKEAVDSLEILYAFYNFNNVTDICSVLSANAVMQLRDLANEILETMDGFNSEPS